MEIKIEELKVLFSEEQIQTRIQELASEMNKFYNGEEVKFSLPANELVNASVGCLNLLG